PAGSRPPMRVRDAAYAGGGRAGAGRHPRRPPAAARDAPCRAPPRACPPPPPPLGKTPAGTHQTRPPRCTFALRLPPEPPRRCGGGGGGGTADGARNRAAPRHPPPPAASEGAGHGVWRAAPEAPVALGGKAPDPPTLPPPPLS